MEMIGFILVIALLFVFFISKGKGEKESSGKEVTTDDSTSIPPVSG
ncbi:hypothetical protein AB4353_19385 [Vibrio breoganii]